MVNVFLRNMDMENAIYIVIETDRANSKIEGFINMKLLQNFHFHLENYFAQFLKV